MVAEVTRCSKEVEDTLALIGVRCTNDKPSDSRLTTEKNDTSATPPMPQNVTTTRANDENAAINEQSEAVNNSTASNCRTGNHDVASALAPEISFEGFLKKQEELRHQKRYVHEKICHARTAFIGLDDVTIFKRDKAVDFYNTLDRSLTTIAGERERIKCFKTENIQIVINAFETCVEELTTSEDESEIEFSKRMIISLVEETRDRFLPK